MDGVGGRVLEDDDAGRHVDAGLDDLEHPAAARDEGRAVDEAPLDVVVAAHRVEVVAIVVVQRRLLPEATERRVRVAVDLDVVRVVVDVAGLDGGHHSPSTDPQDFTAWSAHSWSCGTSSGQR